MTTICGIDEAGRGPVIGPLVFAGVKLSTDALEQLQVMGVKDSKKLTAKKREALFEKIKELADDYCIVSFSPSRIDAEVESETSSLNELSSYAAARILLILQSDEAVLDCPSTNIPAYTRELQKKISPLNPKLVVEHKADENHVIVGASSILAKVTRDRAIAQLEKECGKPLGSGYPSDPATKKFLQENHATFAHFRKSWMTYKNVIAAKSQTRLDSL